jgi:hypothetical protein
MLDNKKQNDDSNDDDDGDGKFLSPMAIQGLYLFAMGLEIGVICDFYEFFSAIVSLFFKAKKMISC